MLKLEKAKARRKCRECGSPIEKGEIAGIGYEENQYGKKKVSFCKVCWIKGLEVQKKVIDRMITKLKRL